MTRDGSPGESDDQDDAGESASDESPPDEERPGEHPPDEERPGEHPPDEERPGETAAGESESTTETNTEARRASDRTGGPAGGQAPTGGAIGDEPPSSGGREGESTEQTATGTPEQSVESTQSPASGQPTSTASARTPASTQAREFTAGERTSGEDGRTGGNERAKATREAIAYLGYAAAVVGFGGVLAAAFLAPQYSVFTSSLSRLGARGAATAVLFNGGLIVGGALGLGFVVYLWTVADQPFHLAAVPFLALAMVAMSLVGVFPIPAGLHFPVAVAFFLFSTLGVLVWGLGDYAAGRAGRAAALLLAPVVHVVTWLWWLQFPWFPPGIAIPELAGVLGLAVWALWVSAEVHGLARAT